MFVVSVFILGIHGIGHIYLPPQPVAIEHPAFPFNTSIVAPPPNKILFK